MGLTTVVCATVGAGLASNAAFGTDSDKADIQPVRADDVTVETMLPATRGTEAAVFSDSLNALASGSGSIERQISDGTVVMWKQGTDVCFEATFPDVGSHGCFDELTIRSGFAYSASAGPRDVTYVFGIVPDDVGSVSIAGHDVPITGNVWYYEPSAGDDMAYTVTSKDGRTAVTLGN